MKRLMLLMVYVFFVIALSACGGGGGGGDGDNNENSAPIANAGADQNIKSGSTVTLSGGGSDADGDLLAYSWTFTSKPAGSTATLSDSTVANPTFIAEVDGVYILALTVNDGKEISYVDSVTITAASLNSAPTANAGPDQNVATGSLVTLSGTGSDADSDLLSFSWTFTSRPSGSTATLSNMTVANPSFTADMDGAYILTLTVNDGTVNSQVDSVTVTAAKLNLAPTANAGPDQNVATGDLVTLNGGGSDADADLLTYSWAFTSKPAGSTATLSNLTVANPTFTANLDGAYVLSLTVNDGTVNSQIDSVTVTAANHFSAFVGVYDGITNGGPFVSDSTTLSLVLTGQSLKITDDAFFSGTCIYSGIVSGTTVNGGTYQCSDFTSGSWTLGEVKVVDTSDIYLSIIKNGNATKWIYGMSSKATNIISPLAIENISGFVGTYEGINNRSTFSTDSTNFSVSLSGTTLTINDAAFFSGTCIYTAEVLDQGNSVSQGTYQCSDFTSGYWMLRQIKLVSENDIYISILKDGNVTSRMYGIK